MCISLSQFARVKTLATLVSSKIPQLTFGSPTRHFTRHSRYSGHPCPCEKH